MSVLAMALVGVALMVAAIFIFMQQAPKEDTVEDISIPRTSWVPIDEVLAVIRSKDWTWYYNYRCKYINIRIDTRSRHAMCLIFDRNGEQITLEELSKQTMGKAQ